MLRAIWPSIGDDGERIVGWIAEHKLSRSCMNRLYVHLSRSRQAFVHARFAKLFRKRKAHMDNGCWTVPFHGRKIVIPLCGESMWLDWDQALSVLGHEPEIKQTYETILDAMPNLSCVFDVGANYGIHSLLFLAHGLRVVSFEPNPVCRPYVERLQIMNNVRFTLEPMALGSCRGQVDLCFPDRDVWLGTTDSERARHMESRYTLERVQVACDTLDGYVDQYGSLPDLIKIDTEGSELEVLRGARRTLQRARPILILESWRNSAREDLWRFLSNSGYVVLALPLTNLGGVVGLQLNEFTRRGDFNFAALPAERFAHDSA